MNKTQFLQRNAGFIAFLTKVIKGEVKVEHGYLDGAFHFSTLEDAFKAYVYPFKSSSARKYKADPQKWRDDNVGKLFPANKRKLDLVQRELRESFHCNDSGREGRFMQAVKRALYWGATGEIEIPPETKRKGTYEANKNWLEQTFPNGEGLVAHFSGAVEALEAEQFNSALFGRAASYRMNAGFTKVYALLANASIIYDGRVGAALGYLVRLYLESTNMEFSDDLNFHWGASESQARYRDPSDYVRGWLFDSLSNNKEQQWASCNVKANWALSASIDALPDGFVFGGYSKSDMLHVVEASLFMLGYDFPLYALMNDDTSSSKPKTRNKNTIATDLYLANQTATRQELIALFVEKAGLTAKSAATYYQRIKKDFETLLSL